MRRAIFVIGVVLGLLLFSLSLVAQTESATLSGRVTDPTGAAVAGAEVTAANTDTNASSSTKTNQTGIFIFPSLQPGPYRLTVKAQGFAGVVREGMVLHVQDRIEQNLSLQVGSVDQRITVSGDASMVNTTDASVSTVVDQTYVKNMPLNGRSFQDLILLAPGALTQTPQVSFGGNTGLGLTGEISINGQRTESNYYTVDGVSANVGGGSTLGAGPSGSLAASTALGTTQALVSVDDLQEFRVQGSTYSAEYGRNPGGQFAFETKSGTNQWHGTAYDYLRNGAFDANDWFNNYFAKKQPAMRQNDFGGTLGGPVAIPGVYKGKDRTFFFVSYEGLRLTAPQAATPSNVPDAALRAAAPAALQPVLNAFPLPNGLDDTANGVAQYIASASNPSSLDSTSVRLDHVVSDKLRLFFRFSDTPSSSAVLGTGAFTPSVNITGSQIMRTYTAGTESTFASRVSNVFRFNYTSNETTGGDTIKAVGGSTPINLQQLSGVGTTGGAQVFLIFGGYGFGLANLTSVTTQKQWNFVDTVSVASGHHHINVGVDYRRLMPQAIPSSPFVNYFYFSKVAVQTNNSLASVAAQGAAYPLYVNFSAFAQDEWRVSDRLHLSLGLRWDVNPAPSVTRGTKPYTVQGDNPSTLTLAPQGTPLWQTTWRNFGPRLGAAYVLHNAQDRETVVRGGFGVFFDTGQQLGSLGFTIVPFTANTSPVRQPASFPAHPAVPPLVNPPVAPFSTVIYGFAPHLQLPYTLQWNVSFEQALGKSQVLTVSNVASHAARLLQENQISGASNPNMPNGSLSIRNGLTSDYNSLQVGFQRRFSQGLTVLSSYTWSHCLDYGSTNYNFGYQRGNCDFDVRHSLSAAFSYDLPNIGDGGFLNAVLHHWGIDDRFIARTSFPITLNGNTIVDPTTSQLYHAGLNLVQGQPVYLYGTNCAAVLQGLGKIAPGRVCPGDRAINPLAFTNVSSGLGNAPRNFARGFGAWQMNLAIRRDFPIRELLKLQFRAEAFNIFNHPEFGTVNPSFGTLAFGQATGTLANSLGGLNPLYQTGGSRSLQFALKLIF